MAGISDAINSDFESEDPIMDLDIDPSRQLTYVTIFQEDKYGGFGSSYHSSLDTMSRFPVSL